MPEEFAVTGVPPARKGAGFEDHIAALRACWGPDPVEHAGPRYQIPRSKIGPKPVQVPLPVLIGGTTQLTVERAARLGNGFVTVFQDWDTTRTHVEWYRGAGGTGAVAMRVNPEQIDADNPAAAFTGTAQSVIADFGRAASLGVDEVLWDLNPAAALEPGRQVDALESLVASMRAS
jgi:alkanesulfonate monooxygenase SsuD/methylene tetrahydromethanopterin reductase-like flavin-dependent oxidoreductase (luciferase family)